MIEKLRLFLVIIEEGSLRRAYPKLKVKMLDQTAGEIITALRGGEIDLALTVGGAGLLSRDFYILAYPERGDGSDRRKASHMGFIHRMAKRENVQPFACLAGQFSTQGQVLRRIIWHNLERSAQAGGWTAQTRSIF